MSSEPDWLDEVQHLPAPERMRVIARVLMSRDTRQVPCKSDHEVTFLGTEGGLDRPCPGCGAAL